MKQAQQRAFLVLFPLSSTPSRRGRPPHPQISASVTSTSYQDVHLPSIHPALPTYHMLVMFRFLTFFYS